MQNKTFRDLETYFKSEKRVLIAYLFGSYAKRTQSMKSDIDIAVYLSETSNKLLEYYLCLMDKLSEMLGNDVDLTILNTAPPMLKHQVIKHGKIIYSQNERTRIEFEARSECEYLDFKRAIERYDECFMKQVLM